ncbi:hypothetical protein TNCV_4672201 [Trichonephila clavipes]|nr:hypothetical protein TNCV_4672201 [Trichonephila clavipes]
MDTRESQNSLTSGSWLIKNAAYRSVILFLTFVRAEQLSCEYEFDSSQGGHTECHARYQRKNPRGQTGLVGFAELYSHILDFELKSGFSRSTTCSLTDKAMTSGTARSVFKETFFCDSLDFVV